MPRGLLRQLRVATLRPGKVFVLCQTFSFPDSLEIPSQRRAACKVSRVALVPRLMHLVRGHAKAKAEAEAEAESERQIKDRWGRHKPTNHLPTSLE